ncbi:MAG: dynamin family protein [Acidimicrobiales bacterium]
MSAAASAGVTGAVVAITSRLEQEQPAFAAAAKAIRERVDGPLQVAIAGRVKAGKSTLLNALVGERLAPTDAGECTRIVSWYRKGTSYQVTARLHDGSDQPLAFQRHDGALDVQLGALTERDVRWLDVRWPASTLDATTLIDTPGIASLNEENSRRTREFLEPDHGASGDADAVIYLMRHVHSADVAFLDAFMDRSVAAASPVNAVAVLSRADEIGAGRLDAMDSARRIAGRYAGDPQIRGLCASVTPLAGLLAETGLTLREDEVANLRTLAATEPAVLERMLLSTEEFCDVSSGDLTVELRRELLARLGMYGVRASLQELAAGATTAAALGPRLVARSGLNELRSILAEHFLPRSRVLKARTAVQALRILAASMRSVNPDAAVALDREVEALEAGAVEFARLRGAHLVTTGEARVAERERAELERLLLAATPAAAVGLTPEAGIEEIRRKALEGVARWRDRAADPLADPAVVEVFETAARSCESIYATA